MTLAAGTKLGLGLLAARWVAAVLRTASPTAEGLPLVAGLAGQPTREGTSFLDRLPRNSI